MSLPRTRPASGPAKRRGCALRGGNEILGSGRNTPGGGRVQCYVMSFPRVIVGMLLLVVGALSSAAPRPVSARPAAPASRPALTPEEQKALAVRQYTRRSIELLRQKNYAEAEKVLVDALLLDPDSSVNSYNMACLKAVT